MRLGVRKRKPMIFALGFDIMVTLALVLAFTVMVLAKMQRQAEASAQAAAVAVVDANARAVEAGKQAAAADQRASDAEGRASDAEGRESDANRRADEAEGKLSAMQPGGPCDLVVIVDCTGSMEQTIQGLQKAMAAIFQWIPYLSKECRIGIVGMRNGVAYDFPIREIQPAYKDAGRSQAELLQFLSSIEVKPSPADHLPCLRLAFKMLGLQKSDDHKQVCLLISDIGPCELDGNQSYSASETASAENLVAGVQRWASQAQNRAFGALYVGTEPEGGASREWFQELSAPSGKHFYTDSSDMFLSILDLIKPQE